MPAGRKAGRSRGTAYRMGHSHGPSARSQYFTERAAYTRLRKGVSGRRRAKALGSLDSGSPPEMGRRTGAWGWRA